MAVSYVGVSTDDSGTGTQTSFEPGWPAAYTPTDGDDGILFLHFGGSSITATDPTDWTDWPDVTNPITQSTSSRAYAWYRRITSADSAPTITVSGSATGIATLVIVRGGVTAGAGGQIGQNGSNTASGTSLDLPTLTGVLDDSMVVAFVSARVPSGTAIPSGITPDADYTERSDVATARNTGTSQNVRQSAHTRALTAAGTLSGDSFSTDQTSSLIAFAVEILAEVEEPPAEEPVVDGAAIALSPRIDLEIDGVWTDITSDVRTTPDSPGVRIVRGRQDWQSTIGPSKCSLAVNNTAGKYSPRNPTGTYYGKIGRNTPIRVSVEVLTDAFGRTSASGWGDADTGQSWTAIEGSADDYTVGSGVGNTIFDAASSFRQVYAAAVSRADVTVAASFKPGAVASGAAIQQALMARRQSSTTFYYAIAIFATDSTVNLMIAKRVSDALTILTQSTDALDYDSSTWVRVEFVVEGTLLRARMWDVADPTTVITESVTDTSISAPGTVGIRNFVAAGNTNTFPLTLAHDDVLVDDVRFVGEVASWPQVWDVTGRSVWAPLEASGLFRRPGVARSALYRALATNRWDTEYNLGTVINYWPLEDSAAAQAAHAAVGGAMNVTGGVDFGAVTGPGGSGNLPDITSGKLIGAVSAHNVDADDYWWILFVFKGEGTSTVVMQVDAGGTLPRWQVNITTSAVQWISKNSSLSTVSTASVSTNALDGEWHIIMCEAYRDGTATDSSVFVDGEVGTATAASHAVGPAIRVSTPVSQTSMTSLSIGHIAVFSASGAAGPLNLLTDDVHVDALNGYPDELAGVRVQRLCDEDGIPVVIHGDPSDTAPCGPQRVATLADLLRDCESADQGILGESRHLLGYLYRTHASLINQTAGLELDYTASHLVPPLEPTEDDQDAGNVITATRVGGSSATVEVSEGPRSSAEPPAGVGAYPLAVTVNAASDLLLPHVAGWVGHISTWDEARWPRVTLELRSSAFTASQFLTDAAAETDLGDVVSIDNPPAWLPPDTVSVLAQGYTEHITSFQRRIEFNMSPAGPYTIPVWGSGTDLSDEASSPDHYDTAGSELETAVDSDDTSLSVSTTLGPIWTTDTDDLPLDIAIGGERMTVTAVSGASSPQTFTVTRSVNSVTKSHSAGADVRLWTRPTYGY